MRWRPLSSILHLEVNCRYSPLYLKWLILIHVVAGYLVFFAAYAIEVRAVFVVFLVIHLFYSVRSMTGTVIPLLYFNNGQWEIVHEGIATPCELSALLFDSSYFMVFYLRVDTKKKLWLIFADQISPKVYHALRILLHSERYK